MSMRDYEIWAYRTEPMFHPGVRIWIAGPNNAMAESIVFKEVDPAVQTAPVLTLGMEKAQQLMDELWDCGLRPAGAAGSAGQLAAVERHLEDMRKLAFRNFNS
jgi:hypothetical protein